MKRPNQSAPHALAEPGWPNGLIANRGRIPSRKKLVLVGAGGHAKVVADIILRTGGFQLVGAVDPAPLGSAAQASGLNILGPDEILPDLLKEGITHATIGLGSVWDTRPRQRLREHLQKLGFSIPVLVHPTAVAATSVRLGAGCQVMAGAILNADCRLRENCVVNTGAIVEHDCELGPDSFVGPRACLGGGVRIGPGAFIGMGAMILQGVQIGARAVIGAGAVVLRNVPAGQTAFGVPAKPTRQRIPTEEV